MYPINNLSWLAVAGFILLIMGIPTAFAADKSLMMCFDAKSVAQFSGKAFKVVTYVGKGANQASGGKALAIPLGAQGEHYTADSVTYRLNIPAAGTYYLWARVFWTSGCGNSFYVAFDAYRNRRLVLGGDNTYNAFHWITITDAGNDQSHPFPLQLKKGVNLITLSVKESGVMVDQFLLTTDREKLPTGMYPPTPGLLVNTNSTAASKK